MATVVVTTNAGLAVLSGASVAANSYPLHIGIGTGTAVPSPTDTALATPSPESHVAATESRTTTNETNDTIHLVSTITSGSGQTIREIGQFTSGGTLVRRAVLDSSLYVTLVNGQDIAVDVLDIFS